MLRRFSSNESGVVFALTAISLPVLLVIAAFSIATSYATVEENRLQGLADFAARYAAVVQAQGGNISNAASSLVKHNEFRGSVPSGVTETAVSSSVLNIDIASTKTLLRVETTTTDSFSGYPRAVQVNILNNEPYFFPTLLSYNTNCLSASASTDPKCMQARVVAVASGASVPCLAALNKTTTGNSGITNSGSVNIRAGCPMISNSPASPGAITLNGVSGFDFSAPAGSPSACPTSVTSNFVCATGFYMNGTSNSTIASSVYNPGSPQIDYPFNNVSTAIPSSIPNGAAGICDKDCLVTRINSGATLDSQKVYECLTISSGTSSSTMKLESGRTYYTRGIDLSGGSDTIQGALSGTTVVGTNTIVIVPTPNGGKNCGANKLVSVTGSGASINIMAPSDTTSPFNGIALIGDPLLTDPPGGPPVSISGGGGNQGINGAVAFPNASIKITGSSAPIGGCQSFYGFSIVLSGSSNFGTGCNSARFSVASMRGNLLLR